MLKIDHINEIHRLSSGEHWSMRRIARHLHVAARTVKKYLQALVPLPAHRSRSSKPDPFKCLIAELLEQDPRAPGAVIIHQRLQAARYSGGHTIFARLFTAGARRWFRSAGLRAHGARPVSLTAGASAVRLATDQKSFGQPTSKASQLTRRLARQFSGSRAKTAV